jgi:hypothetical protein
MVNTENEKILIITVGLVISVLGGVYLYTQNTGINACLKAQSQGRGYNSWSDLRKKANYDPEASGREREILNSARQNEFEVYRVCTRD